MRDEIEDEALYSRESAAHFLNGTIRVVDGAIRSGALKALKLGPKTVRIKGASIKEFREARAK